MYDKPRMLRASCCMSAAVNATLGVRSGAGGVPAHRSRASAFPMIAPAAVSPTVVVTAFPSPPAVSSNTFSRKPMNAPTANPTAAPTSVSRAIGHPRRGDWADTGAAVAEMTASTTIVRRMPVSLFVTERRFDHLQRTARTAWRAARGIGAAGAYVHRGDRSRLVWMCRSVLRRCACLRRGAASARHQPSRIISAGWWTAGR